MDHVEDFTPRLGVDVLRSAIYLSIIYLSPPAFPQERRLPHLAPNRDLGPLPGEEADDNDNYYHYKYYYALSDYHYYYY